MINIPIKISLPEIWQGEFEKNDWNSINFIVGANGTGKTLFSEKLKDQLQSERISNGMTPQSPLKVRLLTAERLSGFEKTSYSYFSRYLLTNNAMMSDTNFLFPLPNTQPRFPAVLQFQFPNLGRRIYQQELFPVLQR